MSKKRHYILHDDRAINDSEDGIVIEAGIYSRDEAISSSIERECGIACYSYKEQGRELSDERFEFVGWFNNDKYVIHNDKAMYLSALAEARR